MATTSTPLVSSVLNKTLSDLQPVELVDMAVVHIHKKLNAQWIDFSNPSTRQNLIRQPFQRYIIGDAPYIWGLWGCGNDVHLYFLTSDNEKRWAEVVAEALEIEVGAKELKEATKDGVMDLSDERLCSVKDGRRTQYWFLKHVHSAKARIVLHYCKISSEWLGSEDLTRILDDTNDSVLPEWPEDVAERPYTEVFESFRFLMSFCDSQDDASIDRLRKIWPLVRAWAPANDLWSAEKLNEETLWVAMSIPFVCDAIVEDQTAESRFVATLMTWASSNKAHRLLSNELTNALALAAHASLEDEEMTLLAVRAAQTSLQAPTAPKETAATPSAATPSAAPSSRFRDAHAALSRLSFDPAHAGVAYEVGYEDRFEGMRWMALGKWGGKRTEEEDWIPEHRVRRIVRVGDGVVVWDRERRVDLTGEV